VATGVYAGKTCCANRLIQNDPPLCLIEAKRVNRAGVDTGQTLLAIFAVDAQLPAAAFGFGVGAPFAVHGAAFEEDSGTDAGAIMDAEFLNIKNQGSLLLHGSPSIFFVLLRIIMLRV